MRSSSIQTKEPHSRLLQADWLKLLPLLGLAFYISFIPHLSYPYPVHVDEWVQMVFSKGIMASQHLTFMDPFLGKSMITPGSNLESGFQVFIGSLQQVSGLSWEAVFRFLPSIFSVLSVLSVYILAARYNFGWEAALFSALIPTSVGILGPAFLVPVSLALLFIPLALFVVLNVNNWLAFPLLGLFCCVLLAVHAPSAICLAIIILPYILINMKGRFKHSAGLFLALALPFLAVFPLILDSVLPMIKSLLEPISEFDLQGWAAYTYLPRIINSFGYLPLALCLAGVFALSLRGGKERIALVLALVFMLIMLVVFYTFHFGIWVLYLRGLLIALLLMSIAAGAGLMAVREITLRKTLRSKAHGIGRYAGKILFLLLVVAVLVLAIPSRQNTIYYQMIDRKDAQAFYWIEENVPSKYSKSVLDPWKGTAFTALSGKNVYTKTHATVTATDNAAEAFLKGGCQDTAFLETNGITLVYTGNTVTNPYLNEIRRNVYLFNK